MPPKPDGRVWLAEVKLWLGSGDGQLVCWDENDKQVGTIVEMEQARLEERQGRQAAEIRVKELEEQLQRATEASGRNGTAGK